MDLDGENINMTVTITDNRTGDSREIRGSPNEVRTALFNETLLSQLNDTERTQALTQANLIIDDIVSSQALWTSVDTSFEINYGPPTEPNSNNTNTLTIHIQANHSSAPIAFEPSGVGDAPRASFYFGPGSSARVVEYGDSWIICYTRDDGTEACF
jgi:hypothetical protein